MLNRSLDFIEKSNHINSLIEINQYFDQPIPQENTWGDQHTALFLNIFNLKKEQLAEMLISAIAEQTQLIEVLIADLTEAENRKTTTHKLILEFATASQLQKIRQQEQSHSSLNINNILGITRNSSRLIQDLAAQMAQGVNNNSNNINNDLIQKLVFEFNQISSTANQLQTQINSSHQFNRMMTTVLMRRHNTETTGLQPIKAESSTQPNSPIVAEPTSSTPYMELGKAFKEKEKTTVKVEPFQSPFRMKHQ